MSVRLATRHTSATKARAAAGVVLAGLLAAGCAHGSAEPKRASVEACTKFTVSAIKRHVAVTSLPPVCRGLTRDQLAISANAAVQAVAATMHGKTLRRARMRELSPLLPALPSVGTAPRSQSVAAQPAGKPGAGGLGVAAAVTWLITVGLGLWMMARWIARGGLRDSRAAGTRARPTMNFAHLGLAAAGLATWIVYLATGLTSLAWTACVLLLPTVGLGMSLLVLSQPERSPTGPVAAPVAASATPAGATPAVAAPTAPLISPARPGPPSARSPSALVVAAHVAFAVATLLFTLLATVGAA